MRNLIFRMFIGVLFYFMPLLSVQAQPQVYRLGVEQGLANNTLYDIVQDQAGYIWLATTESGLLRYDGHHFLTFPVLQPAELANELQPDVGVLLLDSQQRLWAGTWGLGVSRLSADRSRLTRLNHLPLQVQSILEDREGVVWIGSMQGLYRILPDDSMERIGAPGSAQALVHQRVWSLTEGEAGQIWIGTSGGLHLWQPGEGLSAVRQLVASADAPERANEVRALLYDKGLLWIGGRFGLGVFNPVTEHLQWFTDLTDPSAQGTLLINTIKMDQDNNLLLGSYEGLYRFALNCHCFVPFRDQEALLPTLNIRAVMQDRSGVLWLGTRSHGLFFTRYAKNAFTAFQHPLVSQLLRNFAFSVSSIAVTAEQLWVVAGQQLYQFDQQTGDSQSYEFEQTTNKVVADQQANIFIATDTGVYRKTPTDTRPLRYDAPFVAAHLSRPMVRDLLVLPQQRFWFGLWGAGVLYYDGVTGESRLFLSELAANISGDSIQAMTAMPDGTIWVGTRYSGLYQLHPEDGVVRQLQVTDKGLPSDKIQCLDHDGSNLLLVCTNHGLVIWDLQQESKRVIKQQDGLASDNVIGAFTENQRIWMLTAQGLSLKSAAFPHIVTFSQRDGLTVTELNSNAHARADSGILYFGSLQGVIVADPDLLWTNQFAPRPTVTAVKINQGLPIPTETLIQGLRLKASENNLEFHFSAMDYHDVQRNRFYYRLKGVDDAWVYAAQRAYAIYANLLPGKYELELLAVNNHGLVADAATVFQFTIAPKWWQQRLVQVVFGLLVVLVLFLLHRYRLRHISQVNALLTTVVEQKEQNQRQLEKTVDERTVALQEKTVELEQSLKAVAAKNEELTRLDKLKDQFVATVSHELRTPLTGIRGAVSLLASTSVAPGSPAYQKMLAVAQSNSERLAQLINDLLDLQKFESGNFALNLVKLDLTELTQQAIQGIQSYATRFNVRVIWSEQSALTPLWVYADPLRLRQVMDNLLSNAIKFSEEGQVVLIEIAQRDQQVIWSVIDQGRGVEDEFAARIFTSFSQADASNVRNREGTGLGLTICKNIIDKHQGTIGFTSKPQHGSTFWFSLQALQ